MSVDAIKNEGEVMKKIVLGLVLSGGLLSFPTFAGDIEAGKALAADSCASCHGANGIAVVPGYPSLKGQNERYLVGALKAYKNKQRQGGLSAVMQSHAAKLSDQEIDDLAAYFSSLK